jgi:hypothetical protein
MSKRLVMLVGALIVGMAMTGYGVSQATARPENPESAVESTARQAGATCVPASVAVMPSRIHVECIYPVGNIRYFAAPIGDPDTPELLSLLTAALTSLQTTDLYIYYYDDTTSGPPWGCAAEDCRLITSAYLGLKEGTPLN